MVFKDVTRTSICITDNQGLLDSILILFYCLIDPSTSLKGSNQFDINRDTASQMHYCFGTKPGNEIPKIQII